MNTLINTILILHYFKIILKIKLNLQIFQQMFLVNGQDLLTPQILLNKNKMLEKLKY